MMGVGIAWISSAGEAQLFGWVHLHHTLRTNRKRNLQGILNRIRRVFQTSRTGSTTNSSKIFCGRNQKINRAAQLIMSRSASCISFRPSAEDPAWTFPPGGIFRGGRRWQSHRGGAPLACTHGIGCRQPDDISMR